MLSLTDVLKVFRYCLEYIWMAFVISSIIAKLSPSQPANPQLGAEIALLSQLWGTTIHHTPYTQNSSFEVLQRFS